MTPDARPARLRDDAQQDWHLLLALLQPNRQRRPGGVNRSLRTKVNWERFWQLARHHKVEGLAADQLLAHPGSGEQTRKTATTHRGAARARFEQACATIGLASRALVERSVEHLVVKGPAVALRAYDAPSSRRCYDVDLVVRRGECGSAEKALVAHGYEFVAATRLFRALAIPKPTSSERAARFARAFADRHHCQYEFRPPENSGLLHVDLHWRLLPSAFGAPDDREIWAAREAVQIGGVPVSTLDLETTMLHLALQTMRQRPTVFRLLPAVDLAWLLHRAGACVDFAALKTRARRWRAEGHWDRAIDLVAALFPGATAAYDQRSLRAGQRAFAPLLQDGLQLGVRPRWRTRQLGNELRWRLGVRDSSRTLAMKLSERSTALTYRLSSRLPRAAF